MKMFRRDAGPQVLADGPHVTVDADGVYHWRLVENGRVVEERTTTSRQDVLDWSAG